jgi:replicative DNA helicase
MREFNNIQAEKKILSAMAEREAALCYGVENLNQQDFAFSETKLIFEALLSLYKSDEQPTIEKVCMALKNSGGLDVCGGMQKALGFITEYCSMGDEEFYCGQVKELSILRKIDEAIYKINIELDQKYRMAGGTLLEYCRDLFHKVDDNLGGALGIDFRKDFDEKTEDEIVKKAIEFKENHGIVTSAGLKTGHGEMDEMLDGLGESQLIIVAARPSMGKTAFAIDLAANIARAGNAVYFFSIEMAYDEVKERVISHLSNINMNKIRHGNLTSEEMNSLTSEVRKIDENLFIINDKSGIKINEIMSKSRRLKEKYDIKAIFIDYLQYIKSDKPAEFRYLELGDISRNLKTLAKELKIPIVCLSQVSRKSEERPGYKILLSDLKESGSIEQDSDVVMSIIRKDFYDKFDHPGEVAISILKNRRGKTGEVRMEFQREISSFKDLPTIS